MRGEGTPWCGTCSVWCLHLPEEEGGWEGRAGLENETGQHGSGVDCHSPIQAFLLGHTLLCGLI